MSTQLARPRSRFFALVRYTLQSCVPPRRWAAVLLPCAVALLFGLLSRAVDETPERAFANIAAEAILGLAMPIAALVIGDAVLGAEVRAGTFHFTWLSPTPTWQIVLGRWTGGSLVALVTIANGGDNIGAYVPVFATRTPVEIVAIVLVFLVMTALWCLAGIALVSHPRLGPPVRRLAAPLTPFVLMGIGVLIIVESEAYRLVAP